MRGVFLIGSCLIKLSKLFYFMRFLKMMNYMCLCNTDNNNEYMKNELRLFLSVCLSICMSLSLSLSSYLCLCLNVE